MMEYAGSFVASNRLMQSLITGQHQLLKWRMHLSKTKYQIYVVKYGWDKAHGQLPG